MTATPAEAGTSGPPNDPKQNVRFKAFVSYSRAVDGKLAPAFQGALQRFAKPWYRLRAIRVFRDDASLSANPGLWSSIEEALEASEYFVLLASPEAAKSRWVEKEVAYWREHKSHDHMLVVLTDGAIVWDETRGDFAWDETALPRTISGIFAEEPRYTDLRWARKQEHLTLSDARFRSDVADVAAALHGWSKDEVIGEDVRQHRRAVGLAALAIILLAALAAAAAVGGLLALDQRNEARAERDLATSRYLAAQAVSDVDGALPRALLLSLEALRFEETAEARSALLTGLQRPMPEVAGFLEGHVDSAQTVAFTMDGKMLAAGASDGRIRFWDVASRQPIGPVIAAHDLLVDSVAFSPDGRILASAGDLTVKLWDVVSGRRLATLIDQHEGPLDVAFSPDGKLLASAGDDGSIRFWSVAGRRQVGARIAADRESIQSVAFSSDGTALASAGLDGTVRLWDVARHRQVGAPLRHGALVEDVAFSPDGARLASAGSDGMVRVWDWRRNRPLDTPLAGHREGVWSIAFSPDGNRLASGDLFGTIKLWEVGRRRPLKTLRGPRAATTIAFSTDGKTLASGGTDPEIWLWNVGQPRALGTPLLGHRDLIASVDFSPDGRRLASSSIDNTIRLWDVEHARPLGAPLDTGDIWVTDLAFMPDGNSLITVRDDATIRRWDVARRQPVGARLAGDTDNVEGVAFTSRRSMLAYSHYERISLVDVATPRRLGAPLRTPRDFAASLAFSPDGKTLASGSEEGSIRLWDVADRRQLGAALKGHRSSVQGLAFSPDGKTLASGGYDQTMRLWDVVRRVPLGAPLTEHRDWVNSVAFSPDGKTLAAAVADGTIKLWDAERRQPLGVPLQGHDGVPVAHVAFSPDGTKLVSFSNDSTIILWDAGLSSWIVRACALASRNLTQAEWERFIGPRRPYERTCPDHPAGAGAPEDAPVATFR